MFKNRSVVEAMVLTFTGLVAFVLVGSVVIIAILKFDDPDADTDTIVQTVTNLTSGILGALLGLLAGKSASKSELGERPDGTLNGIQGEEP